LDGQAQAYLLRDDEAQGDLFRQLKAVCGGVGMSQRSALSLIICTLRNLSHVILEL
jgi:hypothetical protein